MSLPLPPIRARAWPIRVYPMLLVALFVVIAAAAVAHVKIQTGHEARTAALADTRFSARTAAEQLSQYVAVVKATVQQLASNPQIEKALADPGGCALTFSGLGAGDRGHVDVIGADGTVACTSRRQTGKAPYRYRNDPWLQRARHGRVFVAPVTDSATGAPAAVAAEPTPGGRAVVAAFVDLGTLGKTLVSLYGGGHPVVFLVTTSDGRRVLARSEAPGRWIGKTLPGAGFAQVGGSGSSERDDLDGARRLWAQTPVTASGWRFFAGEDEQAVLAASTSLERRQLLIIGVGLLAALLGAWFVQRQLVRPIRRLDAALRGRSGRVGSDQVPVQGPAEIAELGRNVKALIETVDRELLERERAERAVGESERNYRLLFESNPNPMWVYDSETLRFLAVNDAAVRTYGYTRSEFCELTITEIRPPADVSALHELTDGQPADTARGLNQAGIWRHLRKDGTMLDVEVTSHDHVFAGRPARVVLAVDVTERVRAEDALRRSETRYRDLFENANDLIVTIDRDARLTAVNRRFAEALGYEPAELIGRSLLVLVPPEWHDQMAAKRFADSGDAAGATVYEHELIARDGRRLAVEVSSRAIVENGQTVGVQAICRDITERRMLEEQLRQAQRLEAIGRLAGGIAHDFNNLLTVISGYADALLEEGRADGRMELAEIASAADRAAALTRQLLAFSRQQVLQPRVISVNSVVDGVMPMLGRLIGEDVELLTSLNPRIEPVLADPSQLEQVLVNLVVNARDAMPSGGKLTIETSTVVLDDDYVAQHAEATAGQHTLLAVSDTGIGMDAETASRIFEPFFTTKPVGTGTGLGLASVYGIVKQSGGSIWVYSEPGQGTTFKIYFPIASSDALAEDAPAEEPPAPTGTETILVAEDEPSLRTLVSAMLAAKGYSVVTVESPEQALEIAKEERIDLILTDLVMPRMSGKELAARIRESRPSARVLFMSGYADEAVVRNGSLDAGAAFVEKPFSSNELARRVREVLDERDHALA